MEKSPYKAKRGKNFTKWTKHVVVVVPSANIATIFILNCIILYCTRFIGKMGVVKLDKGGGALYYTLGAKVPKIAICQLSPHVLMDGADFWYGGSFLVEQPLKVAIFPFSPAHPPLPP